LKYRAEIDGLRALAVVPVILFHAGFELFSGGFVGVDVFFVISGYLITTILIEDIENKRFSIVNFYERRARRILPALYALLIFSTLYALYTSPFYARDIFQSIFATTLFSENLLLLYESSDYFALGTEDKFLFHTWSLAVEEQYYVVFPIFLILAWRFGKNRVFWMIVAMAAASLLLSEWGWRKSPSANFYLPLTRAWELFAGSIAAFVVQKHGVQKNNLLSLIGFTSIIFSIIYYDDTIPFPSVYTLVPVLGVVLLVMYADKETIAAKLLSTKGLVRIGLISYSAYLWHQPLIVILHRDTNLLALIEDSVVRALLILLITCFFAAVSYYIIEQPFRYKVGKKIFAYLFGFLTTLLLIASFLGHKTVGFTDLKMELAESPELYIDHFKSLAQLNSLKLVEQNVTMPKVLVIGDSMAGDVKKALSTKGLFVEKLSLDGLCFKHIIERGYDCGVSFDEIKTNAKNFKYVFIATDYIKEKSVLVSLDFASKLGEIADVYFVNGFRFEHASDLSYRFSTGREAYSQKVVFDSLRRETHVFNREISANHTIKLLDKYSYFCADKTQECLLYSSSGLPLRYDELHLTVFGLEYYGDKLVESLCRKAQQFCAYQ
jgi:peptidoglycan/LPS O-acetylase OafA/YrhL